MQPKLGEPIQFFVPGIPRPGGSKRAFPIKKGGQFTGRVAIVDAAGQSNKDWRASVVQFAFEAMKASGKSPLDGPLSMLLTFRMPRPKYHYDSKGLKSEAPAYHTIKPDTTKLTRAVEDAMKGIVFRDDCQIANQAASKVYSDEPGCYIEIRRILY
jgi:Holliday junction resolvase RusA-like endonuclease